MSQEAFLYIGKLMIVSLIWSGLLLASPASYGQNETLTQNVHVFSGKVTSIDWAGNKLTVSYKHEDEDITESITLSVPSNAIFRRESEEMNFSEVQVEDNVQVEFTGDPMVNPVLITLDDMNTEND